MEKQYHTVLTIAGSDGSGGAGIQADLKTIAAHGCYGLSAITSITAQNTLGVKAAYHLPPIQIEEQIKTLIEDVKIDAVKIGMLGNEEITKTIAILLAKYKLKNVVLDPVILSSTGKSLLNENGVESMKEELFPHVTLLTPNYPEAKQLVDPENSLSINQMGNEFHKIGIKSVLIKGGHCTGNEATDYLFEMGKEPKRFSTQKIESKNTHGTGCTLSSAIASNLAKGHSIPKAVENAKVYLTKALDAGKEYKLGNGSGPLHHFFDSW